MTRPVLRVLVTAGPTREWWDDVRFLSNASTGRMGWEIAREASRRGASVTLLAGPCELPRHPRARVVRVETTRDLLRAARVHAPDADLVVFAAAPADWRPASRVKGKVAKDGTGRAVSLRLVENPDVAATLGKAKGRRVHVGFALESGRGGVERARAKMLRKDFDAIVLNGPENVGRGGGRVRWLYPHTAAIPLPSRDKRETARAIVERSFLLVAARDARHPTGR